jgi:sensor histidine kinase YesM
MAKPDNPAVIISTLHGRGVLAVTAGTVILAGLTASRCHTYFTSHHAEVSVVPSILFGIVMWLWWGLVALAMWLLARNHPESLRFSIRTVLAQVLAGSVVGYLHLQAIQLTVRAGYVWPGWEEAYIALNYVTVPRFGIELLTYSFLFAISATLHLQSQRQLDAVRTLELERQLSQAQLKALQMQMEPHFLFNTLNAITSLVAQHRNAEASKTLAHLNTILRNTLQRRMPEKVTFLEELSIIESYLAIQQVRFADRLQVRIDVSPEALECLVPCFLLQPIVENAIKHGIAPMEAGGLIETEVKRIGDTLWLQVRDNGHGAIASKTQGHGIGMQNTRERLAYFYPDAHELSIATPLAGGYQVTIQIPYERGLRRAQ